MKLNFERDNRGCWFNYRAAPLAVDLQFLHFVMAALYSAYCWETGVGGKSMLIHRVRACVLVTNMNDDTIKETQADTTCRIHQQDDMSLDVLGLAL